VPDLPHEVISFASQLCERKPVTEVILFGSRARRDHREDSDVDLLVLLREPSKDDLAHLHRLEEDFNRRASISVQILVVPETRLKRELRAGNLPLYDAMIEGVALYPEVGAAPRHRREASLFSLKAAAAQWLTVAEDSWAGATQGNERVPASSPMAKYAIGYIPAQAHRLAVAAVRSAMWSSLLSPRRATGPSSSP
jgi:predicted nucleotidyltransferase